MLQHEPLEANGVVPLVIMTHETTEGAAARACDAIDKLPPVQGRDGADVGEGLRRLPMSDCN